MVAEKYQQPQERSHYVSPDWAMRLSMNDTSNQNGYCGEAASSSEAAALISVHVVHNSRFPQLTTDRYTHSTSR